MFFKPGKMGITHTHTHTHTNGKRERRRLLVEDVVEVCWEVCPWLISPISPKGEECVWGGRGSLSHAD